MRSADSPKLSISNLFITTTMAYPPVQSQSQNSNIIVMNHPPPPPQLSKRDKKRNMLADRISDLETSFKLNRESHYRQQYQALVSDIHLITSTDVATEAPLEDTAEGIDRMVQNQEASFGGKWYGKFAEDVNNAKEERDASLAQLYVRNYSQLEIISNPCRINISDGSTT
jgi:hypothetical protein